MKTSKREIDRFKRSKAFVASFKEISKKGSYDTDEQAYNVTDWALLPPPAARAESQQRAQMLAHEYAQIAQALGGAPEDETASAMLEMREDMYLNWPGHFTYFYMGPPRRRPLPVMLGVWQMTGERDEQLRMLAGYETEDLVEPPVMESFATERLGTGVKVSCVQKSAQRRGAIVGLLGYAWRSEEFETDLHLRALCSDLGWLQEAMPRIDEFARAIRIVPKH